MSRMKVILSMVTVAVLAVGGALLHRQPSGVQRPADGKVEIGAPAIVAAEPRSAVVPAPGPAAAQAQSAEPAAPASISDEFKRATDYFEFANSILERARNGDADAQYYLYATLSYCDENYRYFFRARNGRTRTLDEALNRVSTRPWERIDVVRIAYSRCSRMFEEGSQDFEPREGWLTLATKGDQPMALVTTAKQMLLNATQASASDGGGAKPQEMLIKALRDKDPEVMMWIGEVQPLLDGEEDEQMLRQWAWWLAACQRGYDCEHSAWMEYACRFDQLCALDRDAVDYIRRHNELDFPAIESLAKEINANIDSGSWDALGLTHKQ